MFAECAGRGGIWKLLGLRQSGMYGVAFEVPHATTKFDLMLWHDGAWQGDGIAGRVEYATALYERSTMERYWGYGWRRLLES